jgi:hypothetical protein
MIVGSESEVFRCRKRLCLVYVMIVCQTVNKKISWCHRCFLRNLFVIIIFWQKYVGYPEIKFGWSVEKNNNLFPNNLYCHLMYIPYATFQHSFHHRWAGQPVLYPCIIKWCSLWCKPHVKWLLWPHRHGIASHQGKFSEAETCENNLALSLGCRGDDRIVMKHHKIPTKHATSLVHFVFIRKHLRHPA